SGGLGVACEGLVRGLLELEAEGTLVLPFAAAPPTTRGPPLLSPAPPPAPVETAARRIPRLRLRRVRSLLKPYLTEELYTEERLEADRQDAGSASLYGPDLSREVLRYSARAAAIASRETFDVIHAHDWLTYLAGLEARRVSGKPLVLPVHATEFDRTDGPGNAFVSAIERAGLAAADRVVAVS